MLLSRVGPHKVPETKIFGASGELHGLPTATRGPPSSAPKSASLIMVFRTIRMLVALWARLLTIG